LYRDLKTVIKTKTGSETSTLEEQKSKQNFITATEKTEKRPETAFDLNTRK